jgi:hemoglobin-like flavoprotein
MVDIYSIFLRFFNATFDRLHVTPSQIDKVQSTFSLVAGRNEVFAESFYTRLFELNPQLRTLFPGDMRSQGRKLVQMIGMAVATLDRPKLTIHAIQELGARHASYGVKDGDYDTVGEAFLWALEHSLGDKFDDETRKAWSATYARLSLTMRMASQSSVSST